MILYFCNLKKQTVNLIIDIGNSVAKVAAFEEGELRDLVYLSNATLSGLNDFLAKYPFERGIIASVVHLTDEVEEVLRGIPFRMITLDASVKLPVVNGYDTPHTLGYDRIAAAVGAWNIQPQRNLLVIDVGTCITYEFISSDGRYAGGNISPGISMRFKAMNVCTSKLPLLGPDGEVKLIGSDTETAMRSGVLKGIEFEMTGYITSLKEKYPDLLVFLTGGNSFSFDSQIKNIIFADRYLVLKGLNAILEYNND